MADRFAARSSGAPVLEIKGLNVFYGRSHALQGVDLTLRQGALSVVGRNGMGKTTLCKAIMGLVRTSSGSIRFAGEELVGRAPADIARLGIGYVPQGRRLWRSLTVDEHLRLVARRAPRRLDHRAHLRHLPAAGGAQVQRRLAAVWRRAADGGDLPRAAAQPAPPVDGRADRGFGPDHRRAGRRHPGAPCRGR